MSPFNLKRLAVTLACFTDDDLHKDEVRPHTPHLSQLSNTEHSKLDKVTPHTPPSSQPSNSEHSELDEATPHTPHPSQPSQPSRLSNTEHSKLDEAVTLEAIDEKTIEDVFKYISEGCKGYKTFDLKLCQSYTRLYHKILPEDRPRKAMESGELRFQWYNTPAKLVVETGAITLLKRFSHQLGYALWGALDRVASENPQLKTLRGRLTPKGRFECKENIPNNPEWHLKYSKWRGAGGYPSFVVKVGFSPYEFLHLESAVKPFMMSPVSACTILGMYNHFPPLPCYLS